jgi:hypothetical protein
VAHRLAGEWAAARDGLEQALGLFESLGTRWQAGRTLFEMGELAQDQDQRARAREYYSAALRALEVMRAVPDAARARAARQALPGN